jgi:hypothetical protein
MDFTVHATMYGKLQEGDGLFLADTGLAYDFRHCPRLPLAPVRYNPRINMRGRLLREQTRNGSSTDSKSSKDRA